MASSFLVSWAGVPVVLCAQSWTACSASFTSSGMGGVPLVVDLGVGTVAGLVGGGGPPFGCIGFAPGCPVLVQVVPGCSEPVPGSCSR